MCPSPVVRFLLWALGAIVASSASHAAAQPLPRSSQITRVRFRHGLAHVQEEITISAMPRARTLRLTLPTSSRDPRAEGCIRRSCTPLLSLIEAGHHQFELLVPPAEVGSLRVDYLAAPDFRPDGVELTLPPTHLDGRPVDRRRVYLWGRRLERFQVNGRSSPHVQEPGDPVEVSARLASEQIVASAFATRCRASRRCAHYHVAAGPSRARPAREVFVLIDRSPSTQIIERETQRSALTELSAGLPSGSRVQRVVFARRALLLDAQPAPPSVLREELSPVDSSLGYLTRISAAWALIESTVRSARRPLVILVGDGSYGLWAEEANAIAEIRDAAEFSVIHLGNRDVAPQLVGSVFDSGGTYAQSVARARAIGSPAVGTVEHWSRRQPIRLRAGESLVWEVVQFDSLPALTVAGAVLRASEATAPWYRWHGRWRPPRGRRARVPRIRASRCEVVGSVSRETITRWRQTFEAAAHNCATRFHRHRQREEVGLRVYFQHGEVVFVSAQTQSRPDNPALAQCLRELPLAARPIGWPTDAGRRGTIQANFRYVFPASPRRPPPLPLAADVQALLDAIR